MLKIKEYNFVIKDEFDKITVRSIKNTDLSFYKNWFKNGHISKDSVDAVSEEEIEKWILNDTKTNYIFIIEFNKKPCGEIILWNDTSLVISDKYYKKPYYSIMIKFYEDINDNDIDNIFNLFITSINKLKIKIGTLYVFIDENEEQSYTDDYIKYGFKYINKESYKTKLEKLFEKKNMENPYKKLKMLIKNI